MVLGISLKLEFEREFTQIEREWSRIGNQYNSQESALNMQSELKERLKTWF